MNRTFQRNVLYNVIATGIGFLGLSYAAVPLYKKFCQYTGIGGNSALLSQTDYGDLAKKPVGTRPFKIIFNADINSLTQWNFKPLQHSLKVVSGEPSLAFYSAESNDTEPVIGIATYTILPYAAAQYFHKIQCFCFEEQLLYPREKIDLPLLFYVDPDIEKDPNLKYIDNIVLSYTFFKSKNEFEDVDT